MAIKTIQELKDQANVIKNEVNEGANTATRVGGLHLDTVESLNDADVKLDARVTTAKQTADSAQVTADNAMSKANSNADQIVQLERNIITRIGLLNPNSIINNDQKQVISAIVNIAVYTFANMDDSDFRLYGMWNSDINPQTTAVLKDYSTGDLCIIKKPTSGNYVGIHRLSQLAGSGKWRVDITINYDAIPWGFSWYDESLERSLQFQSTKIPDRNFWTGKKIVWFGHSIPKGVPGNNYPEMIERLLGCTVWNEGLSSSAVRASRYDGKWKDGYFWPLALSLSGSPDEKEKIISYFSSGLDANGNVVEGGTYGWKDLMPYAPDSLTEYDKTNIRNSSYMKHIYAKYLASWDQDYVGAPDLWIFDHGWNDLNQPIGVYDSDESSAVAIPATRNNRSYYIGAMNFIIDTILYTCPKARIAFISHYENQRVAKVIQAQENLARYWEFPLLRLDRRLGWSQNVIIPTGKTLTETWMPDNIHPHSDSTGAANMLIAEIIADWLKTVR